MKGKIFMVAFLMLIMIITFNNTYAIDNFINLGAFKTAYKLSNEADMDLPFINVFEKSAVYDKLVKHSGISIGESTIDVEEKLEGVHLIMTNDMVTIKGEVEHGIIYGTNIVVEGKISGDSIIMANTVKILESAVIEKDVVIVATDLEVSGKILGHCIGAIPNIDITGTIEGDLRVDATNVSVESGNINGEIYISTSANAQGNALSVKEKYPNAVIEEKYEEVDTKIDGEEIAQIVLDGLKVVIIYTVFGTLITRKENNIISKATNRFIENSTFAVILGTAMLMLVLVLPILLIVLAIMGLGVVAWPILIVYLGIVLLSISISSFVVGMTLYDVLKAKIGKYKIPVLIAIFSVIYALTQISAISMYVFAVLNLVSMAVIMTYIFKRSKKDNAKVIDANISNDEDKK